MAGPKNTATAKQQDVDMQDEIERIMNDIEELTSRMDEVPQTKKVAAQLKVVEEEKIESEDVNPSEATGLEDFRPQAGDESMEETLGQLKEDPGASGGLLDQAIAAEADEVEADIEAQLNVNQIEEDLAEAKAKEEAMMDDDSETGYGGGDQSLSMTLTGNMTLKLKYDFEGQEVTIGFTNGALSVKLADGTEFKVPVHRKNALKRVA